MVTTKTEVLRHLKEAEESLVRAAVLAEKYKGGVYSEIIMRETHRKAIKAMLRVRSLWQRVERIR